ncbi:hypothetical protein QBC35DRAFT_111081 [Podospora australis]|uniref:DUF7582 domain-containing protein n=1 Tax=Podospora australis TaxID=1536484 RepID=A0AAN6WZD7_9PEZI|nr:hypothetical protein QBC35DRAFT_111081 [Podospora australis]
MSPSLRQRISSPLEAGPSISDGYHLPTHVNEALEYASKRLSKKGANVTLLVIRRDYQLPPSPPNSAPTFTPGPLPPSLTNTPLRSTFAPTSRLEALRQLVRPNSTSDSPVRERIIHVHLDRRRDGTASPAFSDVSGMSSSTYSSVSTSDSTLSQRFRWPGSPGSTPMTPATPFTVMSDTSSALSSPTSKFGMRFIHAHPLTPREDKILAEAITKTAKKFKLGPDWISPAVPASALNFPEDLVQKSLSQNETLFSSDHLTLLSLDHLYTFRRAVQTYTRSQAASRLEDAVDELRRLFLANGRRALRKSVLLSSYRWLAPVCESSLSDVCRMYERAYGGLEQERGVENDIDPVPSWPLSQRSSMSLEEALHKEVLIALEEEAEELEDDDLHAIEAWYRDVVTQPPPPQREIMAVDPLRSHPHVIPSPPPQTPTPKSPSREVEVTRHDEMRRTTPKLRPAPPGRSLALKLQTNLSPSTLPPLQRPIAAKPVPRAPTTDLSSTIPDEEEEEEEEEALTARPQSAIKRSSSPTTSQNHPVLKWNSISIDEIMLHGGGSKQSLEERVGPMTPNGYDDISPITRGEWGFLMGGQPLKRGRVEMCS